MNDNEQKYTILLFYKYTEIADPEEFKLEQTALWHNLGITGRMLVATEGVNGTLEGTDGAVAEYVETMKQDPCAWDQKLASDDTSVTRSAGMTGRTIR